MLQDSAGIKPFTSWLPVRCASNLATKVAFFLLDSMDGELY